MPNALKPKTVYPVAESIEEAVKELRTRLPITTSIELAAAIGLYHNTMLAALSEETNEQNKS